MAAEYKIVAGKIADIEDVRRNEKLLEDWIFVDIGFAPENKSCGVAIGNRKAKEVRFAKLVEMVVKEVKEPGDTLNLLLESPLSMAFNSAGNPWPRSFEAKPRKWDQSPRWFGDLKDDTHRGWYRQAGTLTMAGAARLLWKLHECKRQRTIQLFEGFAPRKKGPKSQTGDHAKVAGKLRDVVRGKTDCPIVPPSEITAAYISRSDLKYTQLWPITGIEGWDSDEPPEDCKIPPVVWVPSTCLGTAPESTVGQCTCATLRNQAP